MRVRIAAALLTATFLTLSFAERAHAQTPAQAPAEPVRA